ncbi:MAG: FAD-dependent oxidoreductase, partial [Planctomycetales bacterium]|nr:FAD-dependent oxidoreductase [Planctomycetales bacterium]
MTAELIHGLEQEWAVDLIDLLQRRTMVGLDADFGLSAAGAACAALTRLSMWDHQR